MQRTRRQEKIDLQSKQRQRGKVVARARVRKEIAESLWQEVSAWRKRLEQDDVSNFPVLAGLEESWTVLDEFYSGTIERADVHHVASTPFEALFYHIELGFYPPPELLLALHDAFETYLNGGGALTLEEVFFGKPVRKGGNLAKRSMTRRRYVFWGIRIRDLMDKGMSIAEAADKVSEEIGGKPEGESMIRLIRLHCPFTIKWSMVAKK